MMNWSGNWGMMMGFGGLCVLLFVATVVGIWFLVARARQSPELRPPADTPAGLLRRRYAAGEVTQAEFERASRALGLPEPRAPGAP